eukprot:TRINITY_DN18608_c0_g3_i1.p1 TRINITY_DN18608_c0_g3~~TRINITY_DN18608_c0_g3_i1.p1  ORF type:complete len:695 (-),score=83.63 TRINITY_DN18608_c0_g3_i1:1508-3592(-)
MSAAPSTSSQSKLAPAMGWVFMGAALSLLLAPHVRAARPEEATPRSEAASPDFIGGSVEAVLPGSFQRTVPRSPSAWGSSMSRPAVRPRPQAQAAEVLAENATKHEDAPLVQIRLDTLNKLLKTAQTPLASSNQDAATLHREYDHSGVGAVQMESHLVPDASSRPSQLMASRVGVAWRQNATASPADPLSSEALRQSLPKGDGMQENMDDATKLSSIITKAEVELQKLESLSRDAANVVAERDGWQRVPSQGTAQSYLQIDANKTKPSGPHSPEVPFKAGARRRYRLWRFQKARKELASRKARANSVPSSLLEVHDRMYSSERVDESEENRPQRRVGHRRQEPFTEPGSGGDPDVESPSAQAAEALEPAPVGSSAASGPSGSESAVASQDDGFGKQLNPKQLHAKINAEGKELNNAEIPGAHLLNDTLKDIESALKTSNSQAKRVVSSARDWARYPVVIKDGIRKMKTAVDAAKAYYKGEHKKVTYMVKYLPRDELKKWGGKPHNDDDNDMNGGADGDSTLSSESDSSSNGGDAYSRLLNGGGMMNNMAPPQLTPNQQYMMHAGYGHQVHIQKSGPLPGQINQMAQMPPPGQNAQVGPPPPLQGPAARVGIQMPTAAMAPGQAMMPMGMQGPAAMPPGQAAMPPGQGEAVPGAEHQQPVPDLGVGHHAAAAQPQGAHPAGAQHAAAFMDEDRED